MVFSFFSRKDRRDESLQANTLAPRTRPAKRPSGKSSGENMADVRKRQAEMTAKIDAIEAEMASEFPSVLRSSRKPTSATVPDGVDVPAAAKREPVVASDVSPNTVATEQNPMTFAPVSMGHLSTVVAFGDTDKVNAIEIAASELLPVMEEAAILFANGQNDECARVLREEMSRGNAPAQVWLLLFELYQQTGDAKSFESLAIDFSVQFESSPPAWRENKALAAAHEAPAYLVDAQEIFLPEQATKESAPLLNTLKNQLKSGTRAHLNVERLSNADAEGAQVLLQLLEVIDGTSHSMGISGLTRAAFALRGHLIAGQKDQPEALWLATLGFYRLLGWEQQFDDLAVDYAITFEFSPPSYAPPPKHVQISGNLNDSSPDTIPDTVIEGVACWLKGDVTGRASDAIHLLEAAAMHSEHLDVDCSRLGRIDFSAAGALLNWLLGAQTRGKHFAFNQVHPLAAALFKVIGIQGVADVYPRNA